MGQMQQGAMAKLQCDLQILLDLIAHSRALWVISSFVPFRCTVSSKYLSGSYSVLRSYTIVVVGRSLKQSYQSKMRFCWFSEWDRRRWIDKSCWYAWGQNSQESRRFGGEFLLVLLWIWRSLQFSFYKSWLLCRFLQNECASRRFEKINL